MDFLRKFINSHISTRFSYPSTSLTLRSGLDGGEWGLSCFIGFEINFSRLILSLSKDAGSICLLLMSFTLTASSWYGRDTESLAMIKDPVVDCFLSSGLMQNNPPASPIGYADGTCRRAHQGLAHEVVSVTATDRDNAQIVFDNVIYGFNEQTRQPQSTFWTKKKHLVFLKDVSDEALDAIPGPWSAQVSEQGASSSLNKAHDALILTRPWKYYSVGTRFVHDSAEDTKHAYGVKHIDFTGASTSSKIPKKYARIELSVNAQEARQHFVKLANDLVDYASRVSVDKIIPYVWGGSSYVHEYQDGEFVLKDGWRRPTHNKPYAGYDCSEFVLRLAQISGISYFNKTTVMLCQRGTEIGPHDILEEGDLFWAPGHVMIVSDIARNEIIEAVGYSGGYGKVQRISLSKRFAGIENYDQLRRACYTKKPLQYLSKDGLVSSEVKECKFFKLIPSN